MHQLNLECWQVLFLRLFFVHSLSTSSLGCKALSITISFLDLWSICWRSSFVHFKNGPEYLTKGTAKVFIPLMRFLQCNLVSSRLLLLLRYSFFKFFLSSPFVWWCRLLILPSISKFPLLRAFRFFLDLVVLFLPSFVVFRFSLSSGHIFPC